MLDEPDTLDLTTVDTEREAASGAVSDMEVLSGPVQEAVSTINNAGNPINLMDSLSSTLGKIQFNRGKDGYGAIPCYALIQNEYGLAELPDPSLCPSSMDRFQFYLQGSPIAHFFDDKIRSTFARRSLARLIETKTSVLYLRR